MRTFAVLVMALGVLALLVPDVVPPLRLVPGVLSTVGPGR